MPHHQPIAYPFRWAWLAMSLGTFLCLACLHSTEVTGRQCHTQIFPWGLSICGALMFMLLHLKDRTISPASLFFSLRKTTNSHSELQTPSTGPWCEFWLYSAPICSSHCPLLWPLCIFILLLSVDYLGPGVLLEAREESVQSVHSRPLRSKDDGHTALAH